MIFWISRTVLSELEPHQSPRALILHAVANEQHMSQQSLRWRMAFLGRQRQPANGGNVVLRDAPSARHVHASETKLRVRVAEGRRRVLASLVANRQSLDRLLDRQWTVLDIAEKPHFSLPPPFRDRHRVLLLGDIESYENFAMLFHGPPSVHEARLGPPEQPSFFLPARKGGPPAQPANMTSNRLEAPSAIRSDLGAIFVSMELSRSIWLITSLSPRGGEKMSKHSVPAGDIGALLARFSETKQKALARTGRSFPIIVIQEAGLDGFWIYRALESEGIESHVVDPASIATSRRRRRAKTDSIDGEALLRALLAYKRGEPRVCAMVKAPTPKQEDSRRLCRERKVLTNERVLHVNRVKGLLFSQGVSGYEPLRRDRRQRLDELRTGDGRPLPVHLKAQICRELDRLELLIEQIKAVEAERDAMLAPQQVAAPEPTAMLLAIKGVGPEFAAVLWSEGLFRHFNNRRQVASYAGLAPTPWQSGSVDREQGVSKAGNPRLRTTLIQLAWLWLRHQPQSALALWFEERVRRNGGHLKKTTIVALARKLLVALWKYVTAGVIIEGAVIMAA